MKNIKLPPNYKFSLNSLFTLFFTLIITFSFSSSIFAIEYNDIGGKPAFPRSENERSESIFIHTVAPGSTINEGIQVINNSSERKTLEVYAVDSTTATDGAFACEQKSAERDSTGTWIDLEKSQVVLESGTNEIVPFTIRVPENANVGESNACLVVQENNVANNDEFGSTSGIDLSLRTAIRVQLTVPGEIDKSLELIGIERGLFKDAVRITPSVKNSGNVSIDTDLKFETYDTFGNIILTDDVYLSVLVGDTSIWNYEYERPDWGGFYKTDVTLIYNDNNDARVGELDGDEDIVELAGTTEYFLIMPKPTNLMIIVGGLLAIVLIVGGIIFYFAYVKKLRKKWIDYTVGSEDENIEQIAKKYNVNWKLVAKVNKLSAPYNINKGDTIKVPEKK